jgi:hypothetical protein
MTVPMGFAAQIRALQVAQREQAVRLATLEQENADLKAFKESAQDFFDRIDALEQQNTHLATRRRECVAQLLNLRTLHQEASNAFDLRGVHHIHNVGRKSPPARHRSAPIKTPCDAVVRSACLCSFGPVPEHSHADELSVSIIVQSVGLLSRSQRALSLPDLRPVS